MIINYTIDIIDLSKFYQFAENDLTPDEQYLANEEFRAIFKYFNEELAINTKEWKWLIDQYVDALIEYDSVSEKSAAIEYKKEIEHKLDVHGEKTRYISTSLKELRRLYDLFWAQVELTQEQSPETIGLKEWFEEYSE